WSGEARAPRGVRAPAARRARASARGHAAPHGQAGGNGKGVRALTYGRRLRPARVDFIRAAQCDFFGPIEPRIDRLDALREAVVLVRDLVLPCAESSAAEHAARLERRLDAAKPSIAMQRRHGIPMFEPRVPDVMDLCLRRE